MPTWLRTYSELADFGELAIAIAEVREGQRHTGAYYRAGDGRDGVWFLHLAFHREMQHEPAKAKYRWVEPVALDPTLRQFIGTLCRALASGSPDRLPYGFGVGRFDPSTGTFEQAGRRRGLTCATFVLALFAAYEIDLVDLDTWGARESDRDWQERIVAAIEAHFPNEAAHVQAIRDDVGECARVRPEEVAAAASSVYLPVSFEEAARLGAEIVTALRA
ncbi:MAG: hypothetical protein IT378_21585 [Sandaracinaceae bacterium]|nr:hypothetical protein [Sandaracinaceae bacterium]